jgi:tRNA pseudouridine55 synthase
MLPGILNLKKPDGPSSAAMVGRVKRMLPRGIKVGHAGTLDPFASGVLVILIGREATKRFDEFMAAPKQYVATVCLGATTPTDDRKSEVSHTPGIVPVDRERLEVALTQHVGAILQQPPAFSALKLSGMRISDRLRAGEQIETSPRLVRIDALELLDYAWPNAVIRVDCGRGTYLRAIARDIGLTLGVGGYLTELCRTRVCDFRIDTAVPIDALTPENVAQHISPLAVVST